MKLIPDAYYKDIYEIDYNKLKKKGFKYIIFDVDNTLIPYTEDKVRRENKFLITKLKKMGLVPIIMSNSRSKRVNKIIDELKIEGYVFSMKPLKKNYNKIIKKYNKDKCIFIGDQLMTDVKGAKRCGFKVILVDRINEKEPFTTKFWRKIESRKIKKYKKKKEFIIGEYYNNI